MMPHSGSNSATKEKNDFGRPELANRSPDMSPTVPVHECVELLWENGQIVMQGISNRAKEASFPTNFPSISEKDQEIEVRESVTTLKVGSYKAIGSVGNGFQTTVPSEQTRMDNQEDEMVPWLKHPIEDYYLKLLSEVSGVDLNSPSPTAPADRITSDGQAERDTNGLENASTSRAPAGCSVPDRMRNCLFKFQQQSQTVIPSSRLKDSDLAMVATDQCCNGDLPIKMQKQDLTSSKVMQPSSIAPSMNFSHFSRLAALVKFKQCVDGMNGSEKACTPASSNPVESKLIKFDNGLRSVPAFHGQMTSVASEVDLKWSAQPAQETVPLQHSEPICQEDAARNSSGHNDMNTTTNFRLPDNMYHGPSFTAGVAAGKHRTHKPPEPATASPSMCSANGAGAASNDVKNRTESKSQGSEESEYQSGSEESEYQSEDFDDDSVGIRKHVTGRRMSTKRSRPAGVQNLSERRQRGRINEKMRALQRLIPNCTKVDKASMLDEAIEYLKTLQMQVQIMSMCSGLRMTPMMLPSGTQHIHPSHVGPFAPIGASMGMAMGLGFGMGMLEMTGSSMVPIPHMHRPLYPCAIPGTAGLHRMTGSTNLQMPGTPGQTLSMSMPHPAPFTPSMGVSMKVNPAPEVAVAEVSSEQATDSAPPNSKNQQLQALEPLGGTSANKPQVETSRQANKEYSEHPSLVQIGNQSPNIDSNKAINKETELGLWDQKLC